MCSLYKLLFFSELWQSVANSSSSFPQLLVVIYILQESCRSWITPICNGANFRRTKPVFKSISGSSTPQGRKKYLPSCYCYLISNCICFASFVEFRQSPTILIINSWQVKNSRSPPHHVWIATPLKSAERNFTLQPDQGTVWCPDNGIPVCVCLGEWAEATMLVARFRMINQLQSCAALCKFNRENHIQF